MTRCMLVLVALLLSGCANPYTKFYDGAESATINPRYVPPDGPVRILPLGDKRSEANMLRRGFRQIGYSAFKAGTNVTREQMIEQAERIGAEIVLSSVQYSHTESGSVVVAAPTSSTSNTNAQVTAYGSNGRSATAYGSATTTTRSTQLVQMPYSVRRSDFVAVYFARVRPQLGVIVSDLTPEDRRARGSNVGVTVEIVIVDSPAFFADVLEGDLLIAINDQPVGSVDAYERLFDRLVKTGPVKLTLERSGAVLHTVITPEP